MRTILHPIIPTIAVALFLAAKGPANAGSLDSTNAPAPTMHTLEDIYQKVQGLNAQSTTSAPMHTLDDIYHKVTNAPVQPLQTLSAATTAVTAGYYAGTNLTQVDTDLVAANIRTNVTIFGVVGTLSTNAGGGATTAPVPKTGQTAPFVSGDDGTYQKGVAWPSPRFTVLADTNCVRDNLTGLVWARNAGIWPNSKYGPSATNCENLVYGGTNDWRVPNFRELESLVDYGVSGGQPVLPTGHPFDLPSDMTVYYWSSTGCQKPGEYFVYMWCITFNGGGVQRSSTTANGIRVWPVRGP